MNQHLRIFLNDLLRDLLSAEEKQPGSNNSPNPCGTPPLEQENNLNPLLGHNDLSSNSFMVNPPKLPPPQMIPAETPCVPSPQSETPPNVVLTHLQWMQLNERIQRMQVMAQFSEGLIQSATTKGPIVTEAWKCENCGVDNWQFIPIVHAEEIVKCGHCGTRTASKFELYRKFLEEKVDES